WDDRLTAVLDCTGGGGTEQEWSGGRGGRVLPDGAAGTGEVTSATGYRRRPPLTDNPPPATALGRTNPTPRPRPPAPPDSPGRRGYHWVKWIVRIDHDTHPWWVEPPLPLH